MLASRGDAAAALPTLKTMVRLIGADQVAIRARSAQGLSYAYATTLLPNHWRLIAATSAQNEHDEGIRNLLVRMAELAALLLVGFAAVILGADVAFGSPVRRLTAAVRRWQDGGAFDPGPLPGAPDEVADLARSFRDATGVLRQREAELVQAKERQDLLVLEIHTPGEEQPAGGRQPAEPAGQPHPHAGGAGRVPGRAGPGARPGDAASPPVRRRRACTPSTCAPS